jgi:hypothetical protein
VYRGCGWKTGRADAMLKDEIVAGEVVVIR